MSNVFKMSKNAKVLHKKISSAIISALVDLIVIRNPALFSQIFRCEICAVRT